MIPSASVISVVSWRGPSRVLPITSFSGAQRALPTLVTELTERALAAALRRTQTRESSALRTASSAAEEHTRCVVIRVLLAGGSTLLAREVAFRLLCFAARGTDLVPVDWSALWTVDSAGGLDTHRPRLVPSVVDRSPAAIPSDQGDAAADERDNLWLAILNPAAGNPRCR